MCLERVFNLYGFICRGCMTPVTGTCTSVDIGVSANFELVDWLCFSFLLAGLMKKIDDIMTFGEGHHLPFYRNSWWVLRWATITLGVCTPFLVLLPWAELKLSFVVLVVLCRNKRIAVSFKQHWSTRQSLESVVLICWAGFWNRTRLHCMSGCAYIRVLPLSLASLRGR